jgi:hypothetical protein
MTSRENDSELKKAQTQSQVEGDREEEGEVKWIKFG